MFMTYYIYIIFYIMILDNNNNILIFRLYLIVISIFLLFICILITSDLLKIIWKYILLIRSSTLLEMSSSQIVLLSKIYISSKQWLLSLAILESGACNEVLQLDDIYNNLGYCYRQIEIDVAIYYYKRALFMNPNQISTQEALNELYNMKKRE